MVVVTFICHYIITTVRHIVKFSGAFHVQAWHIAYITAHTNNSTTTLQSASSTTSSTTTLLMIYTMILLLLFLLIIRWYYCHIAYITARTNGTATILMIPKIITMHDLTFSVRLQMMSNSSSIVNSSTYCQTRLQTQSFHEFSF